MVETNKTWVNKEYVFEEGLQGAVPCGCYQKLQAIYYKHQLFLDDTCITAMELILEIYGSSFPFVDGGGNTIERDANLPYSIIEYLQPRLAELFKNRIGLNSSKKAEREIALFGAIRILNHYHFREIELPIKGSLRLKNDDRPSKAVNLAEEHFNELITKLNEFKDYLRRDDGFFHEAESKVSQYLKILSTD